MNTKFSFGLIVVAIALFAAACAPNINASSGPIDPAQPVDEELVAPVPNAVELPAESVRTASEPRLWSGEVFLSDNNNPDYELNLQSGAKQDLQNECISEDSLPRRYGGCVE